MGREAVGSVGCGSGPPKEFLPFSEVKGMAATSYPGNFVHVVCPLGNVKKLLPTPYNPPSKASFDSEALEVKQFPKQEGREVVLRKGRTLPGASAWGG